VPGRVSANIAESQKNKVSAKLTKITKTPAVSWKRYRLTLFHSFLMVDPLLMISS
jgi:hypothetical protein